MAQDQHIDLSFWFEGFMDGVSLLDEPQRNRLFRSCARRCLAQGTMAFYGELFERAHGNIDSFFRLVDEVPGVAASIEQPGGAWKLSFMECTCPLHGCGLVNAPELCECSRQSVTLAMHELWPDERFAVELEGSILAGDDACTLGITRR